MTSSDSTETSDTTSWTWTLLMLPLSVPSRIVRTSLTVPVYGLRLIQENFFNPAPHPSAEPRAGIEPEFHPEEDCTDGIVYTVVHFGLERIQSILSYLWHLPLVESVQTQVGEISHATGEFMVTYSLVKPVHQTLRIIGLPEELCASEDTISQGLARASSIFGPTRVIRTTKWIVTEVLALSKCSETPNPETTDPQLEIANGFEIDQEKHVVYEVDSIWDPQVQKDLGQLGTDVLDESVRVFQEWMSF